MVVAIQLYLADPADVAKGHEPLKAGVDFTGMTAEQARTAIKVLNITIRKIEARLVQEEEAMKKYGTGEVLPEPGDHGPEDESEAARALRLIAALKEDEGTDQSEDQGG